MKKNMGSMDRVIRTIIAILAVVLYLSSVVSGTFGTILVVLSAVFLLTSLISFCPFYAIVGISTCPAKKV